MTGRGVSDRLIPAKLSQNPGRLSRRMHWLAPRSFERQTTESSKSGRRAWAARGEEVFSRDPSSQIDLCRRAHPAAVGPQLFRRRKFCEGKSGAIHRGGLGVRDDARALCARRAGNEIRQLVAAQAERIAARVSRRSCNANGRGSERLEQAWSGI